MADNSLSKSRSKLNLTRRQISIFQKIILLGNQMAEMLADLEFRAIEPKVAIKLAGRWSKLMVQLVKILI